MARIGSVEANGAPPKLSERGDRWSRVEFLHGREGSFDPETNPHGVVRLDNSENTFMHEDLAKFINAHNHFDPECLAYGEGYTGTLRLRKAMANHLTKYFAPVKEFEAEEITFTAGVTELNEVCSMVTCDPGEWIMVGGLVYGTFNKDLNMRTGVNVLRAPVGDTEQFSPDCVAGYEKTFEEAKAAGLIVRALVICNPSNPLGRCYPPETLKAILRFCAAKQIHLISDEIYALSVYQRNDRDSEVFTSVRAVDFDDIIDPRQVHVLYGLSKDYGAAGMRLGCVLSQNKQFTDSVRAVCRFSSPSQFSMDLAAKFLEDEEFVRQFLENSHSRLLKSRVHTEKLLQENNIKYHDKGNAGLFIWLDLSPYLPLIESSGDGWAAERKLAALFEGAGVLVDSGEAYTASQPGGFRLVHTVKESTVTEGIRRISAVLSRLQN